MTKSISVSEIDTEKNNNIEFKKIMNMIDFFYANKRLYSKVEKRFGITKIDC